MPRTSGPTLSPRVAGASPGHQVAAREHQASGIATAQVVEAWPNRTKHELDAHAERADHWNSLARPDPIPIEPDYQQVVTAEVHPVNLDDGLPPNPTFSEIKQRIGQLTMDADPAAFIAARRDAIARIDAFKEGDAVTTLNLRYDLLRALKYKHRVLKLDCPADLQRMLSDLKHDTRDRRKIAKKELSSAYSQQGAKPKDPAPPAWQPASRHFFGDAFDIKVRQALDAIKLLPSHSAQGFLAAASQILPAIDELSKDLNPATGANRLGSLPQDDLDDMYHRLHGHHEVLVKFIDQCQKIARPLAEKMTSEQAFNALKSGTQRLLDHAWDRASEVEPELRKLHLELQRRSEAS